MNAQLRRGEKVNKRAKEIIKAVRAAKELEKETEFYRGLDFNNEVPAVELAVMSVTDDEDVARKFINGRIIDGRFSYDGIMLILNVKPGVRVLKIGGTQSEWLIEPGVTLTETHRCTTSVKRGDGKITYVWCDVSKV